LCGIESDNENQSRQIAKPSLVLKLGHTLAKLAQLKKGMAIRNSDTDMRHEAEAFACLHESEYTDMVSLLALNTLRQRKYNIPDALSLTDELLKLKGYQEQLLQTNVMHIFLIFCLPINLKMSCLQ